MRWLRKYGLWWLVTGNEVKEQLKWGTVTELKQVSGLG